MPKDNLTSAEIAEIEKSISEAEKKTSGEIRLFIDNYCKEDVLDRAAFIFHKIGMDRTKERTGVLIYVAFKEHKFAIIGDQGINAKVPENFWNSTRDEMLLHFKKGEYVNGLKNGIQKAGEQLVQFFPAGEENKNELSDEIQFGR